MMVFILWLLRRTCHVIGNGRYKDGLVSLGTGVVCSVVKSMGLTVRKPHAEWQSIYRTTKCGTNKSEYSSVLCVRIYATSYIVE